MSLLRFLVGLAILLLLSACRSSIQEPTETTGSITPTHEALPTPQKTPLPQNLILGTVIDDTGTVAGATVRIQTSEFATLSDGRGEFKLEVPEDFQGDLVNLTAWAPGYFCGGPVEARPGEEGVEIHLHAHAEEDNQDYAWLPSQIQAGEGENQLAPRFLQGGCAECHSKSGTGLDHTLPVDEWLEDAHSQTTQNLRFLTMYAGTDVDGNQSPDTRYGQSRDYGRFPLRPDPDQPYYGPGYKLDFPETAGNCAACHAPAASVNQPYEVDTRQVTGVPNEGLPCDFCHKIWDVRLDTATGLPHANMPGVLSFEFRRPPEGHQFFAGPFDDVAPGEDTFSPLQTQSQICAPCHFGVFWDTQVYNSFGEWLDSPYSDPEDGQTCQDCHMPPINAPFFARPDKGGLARNPETIFSHRMPGATDQELLQNAVTMVVETSLDGGNLNVAVSITNDLTGHHVPTDSPLRHLILLVGATDEQGRELEFLQGPAIPEWGGVGDPPDGYYAGLPGKIYAKVLEELWTEISPSGAYWNPTRLVSDNRLAAFETDTSSYSFAAPEGGEIEIMVQLFFRRAFIELRDQKGWQVPDMLMESESIRLTIQ